MGNEDKYTPIELDKPRRLLLDLNAMVDFEKATGKNFSSLGKDISASELRALLWACLRHEEELLLQSAVGAMIHAGNMAMVAKTINIMLSKGMPEKKPRKKKTSPLATSRA